MTGVKVSVLVLFVTSGLVSAQFEAIQECVTDELLEDVVGCLVAKFDGLLDLDLASRYFPADETLYTGRRLLYTHADDVMRKNFMPQVMERLAKTHKGMLRNLASVAHFVKNGMKDETILTKIKHLNLKQLARRYLTEVALNLVPLTQNAEAYRHTLQRYAEAVLDQSKIIYPYGENDDLIDELCELLGPDSELCELLRIVQCLGTYEEADFEDGLDWLSCLFNCNDLPIITQCVADVFNTTSDACREVDWLGDIIVRIFMDVVDLQTCYFKIESPEDLSSNTTLILEEGDEPTIISFRTYLPPRIMCLEPNLLDDPLGLILGLVGSVFNISQPCEMQVQMSTSMYLYDILPYLNLDFDQLKLKMGRPKCRSDVMMHQAAIGWFDEASNYSCTINITEQNWNNTFHVPVVATVDHKNDGDIDINFTLKMTKDGETYNTTKIPLLIKDRDPEAPSVCQSVNDPHILTFDGHYYNNLYHGYFYLYKHATLPYEVQAIYQACSQNTTESCNCGIAVRSGDDVFVVDKCRKRPAACSGQDCQVLRVYMYTNGDITPGTRVFVKNGGIRYDVFLPHGTMVRIMTAGDLLNAYVIPSVYDRDLTSGLCGVFNEDISDELTMPDGSIYTGEGSEMQGQPRPFNKAWRVPEEERIFSGTTPAEEPFEPLKVCKCHHILMEGVECTCGEGDLMEYCDLDTDGELMENISAIIRKSARTLALLQGREFRNDEDDRDINEDYEPNDIDFKPGGNWNRTQALLHCRNMISPSFGQGNAVIQRCRLRIQNNAEQSSRAIENCMDDIKITDNTHWDMTHVEVAKQYCLNAMNMKINHTMDGWNLMENDTCQHNCYDRGVCVQGVCECDPGYMGADCYLTDQHHTVVMEGAALCDSRYEDCQYATIFGHNFDVSQDLMCVVQAFSTTEGATRDSELPKEVGTLYISSDQIACRLPSAQSFEVLLQSGTRMLDSAQVYNPSSFIFMASDSMCYECNTAQYTCKRKTSKDHCLIRGGCFAPGEEKPDDHCSICNISESTEDWTDRTTDECIEIRAKEEEKRQADHKDMVIRASVSAGLCAIIIIVAFVLFIIDRRNQKTQQSMKEAEEVVRPEDGTIFFKPMANEPVDLDDVLTEKVSGQYKKLDTGDSIQDTNVAQQSNKEDDVIQVESHTQPEIPSTSAQGECSTAQGHDNPAMSTSDDESGEVFHPVEHSTSSVRVSAECADVLRVKAEIAAQGRTRTTSVGSNASRHSVSSFFRLKNLATEQGRERTMSASSTGIGGGGPTHYARFLSSVTDSEVAPEMHGIGGHGTPLSTPGGKRKDYHNVPIARF